MPFIVFEGLDGSGKSSLINVFEDDLKNKGISYVRTREPGGTGLGEEIRNLILRHSSEPPTPRTELLLYQASRSQHVDLLIRPHIEKGDWVLCDRFTASSLAFQGAARGISYQDVVNLNRFATNSLQPDLTVLLDLSVNEAKNRRSGRQTAAGEDADRIEA
ncbi:MAG: dTMP kinase [Pseudobdellovibrionaceae bacterium]